MLGADRPARFDGKRIRNSPTHASCTPERVFLPPGRLERALQLFMYHPGLSPRLLAFAW